MFCALCGAANSNDGRFCSKCGAALQGQKDMPPPGAGYGAPQQPYTGPTETSGKAIGSLLCGLLFFIFPIALLAIVLGHLSLSDIRKAAGRITGRGMAIAGLALGYTGMSVIPVMIIAAIAIPNLLRARMAANEASAAASLRTIHAAAIVYSQRYSNGFPQTFSSMDSAGTGKANCDHAELLDWPLVSGQKDGYVFEYIPPGDPGVPSWSAARTAAKGCTFPGVPSFNVHANPVTRGTTGQRSFFTDETGIIRYETNGPATVNSPPLQ